MRILVIDDDGLIGQMYRRRLVAEGFEVEVVADGQEGFYRIHDFKPDGVLLDLMLPTIDGLEILKKVRAQKQFESMPIIVFSNLFRSSVLQDVLEAGATRVFNKSATRPQEVVTAFREAFSQMWQPPAAEPASGKGEVARTAPNVREPAPELPPPFAIEAPVTFHTAKVAGPEARPRPVEKALTLLTDDDMAKRELRTEFFSTLTADPVAELRGSFKLFMKSGIDSVGIAALNELARGLHTLGARAGIAELPIIAQVASVSEAFVLDLAAKPQGVNPSVSRTLAQAIDFLALVLGRGVSGQRGTITPPRILVVDDEVFSRKAVVHALEKTGWTALNVGDSARALELAAAHRFDLIFLDVDMPKLTGFELCAQLRQQPHHKETPVVFVTGLTDFESRAKSAISGGTDLIGKPFHFLELALKAILFVFRRQTA